MHVTLMPVTLYEGIEYEFDVNGSMLELGFQGKILRNVV